MGVFTGVCGAEDPFHHRLCTFPRMAQGRTAGIFGGLWHCLLDTHSMYLVCPPALQSWLWLCGALHQSVSRMKVSLMGALSCVWISIFIPIQTIKSNPRLFPFSFCTPSPLPVSPEPGVSYSLNECFEHEIHSVSPVTKKEQIYQINPSRPVHVTVWYSAIKNIH